MLKTREMLEIMNFWIWSIRSESREGAVTVKRYLWTGGDDEYSAKIR